MKCPYCRNEIADNSNECSVCGVDLTYQQRQRHFNSFVGLGFIVFGITCLIMGIIFGLISASFSAFSKVNTFDGVRTYMSFIPILIGVVITGIGIYNFVSSRNLKSGEETSTKVGKHVSGLAFIIMFNTIWIVTLVIMSSSMSVIGDQTSYILIGIFLIVPIFVTIAYIVSLVRGVRK